MDGATLSPFPHHSWIDFQLEWSRADRPMCSPIHQVAHLIHKASRGRHAVRWISRGRETSWQADHRTVHFAPADGEQTIALTSALPDYAGQVICIPKGHLRSISESEGMASSGSSRRILSHDDAVLQSCMTRLASPMLPGDRNADVRKDEAARRLVLRLVELSGGGLPEWQSDESVFDRRMLGNLVAHIDEHLRVAPGLGDMAIMTGLSPSHFARKFRYSTGLSLHRFINRRRLQASLELLKQPSRSVAQVAVGLGFSSQSHFTRLFSDLTGLTPAKYRKQFTRIVG